MYKMTLSNLPNVVAGDGRRVNNGKNKGALNVDIISIWIASITTWDSCSNLVEYTAVVRIKAALVEEEALLHCKPISAPVSLLSQSNCMSFPYPYVHLLKPLTGVDISARSVRRSGRAGKATASSRRRAAAAAKRIVLGCSW
jgi:hypothetical protein